MPNFNHLKIYLTANMLTLQEFALALLMALGAQRMLADATLSWFSVHSPAASAEWLPYDLLAIAVLVALTPVPSFAAAPKTAQLSGADNVHRLPEVENLERKMAA